MQKPHLKEEKTLFFGDVYANTEQDYVTAFPVLENQPF